MTIIQQGPCHPELGAGEFGCTEKTRGRFHMMFRDDGTLARLMRNYSTPADEDLRMMLEFVEWARICSGGKYLNQINIIVWTVLVALLPMETGPWQTSDADNMLSRRWRRRAEAVGNCRRDRWMLLCDVITECRRLVIENSDARYDNMSKDKGQHKMCADDPGLKL